MHADHNGRFVACGHSFCYMCIITHLRNKNDCPCCACYLIPNLIFPNSLLHKILKRTSACQLAKRASPVEHLRRALQQGCEISTKEIDELLYLLTEKKRKIEQNEAETNMRILLDFLCCLRKKKLEDLEEFNELHEHYFQKHRYWARLANKQEEKDENVISRDGYNPGLQDFESVLMTFTRHRRLRVIAELRHADIFHSANIVSSIEFDRDDELFATAGVSSCIKVVNEPTDMHCPIAEMPMRSKLMNKLEQIHEKSYC